MYLKLLHHVTISKALSQQILMILGFIAKGYITLRALLFCQLSYCLPWTLNNIKFMVIFFIINIMSFNWLSLSFAQLVYGPSPTNHLYWTINLDITTNCIKANLSGTSYSLWTNLVGRKSGIRWIKEPIVSYLDLWIMCCNNNSYLLLWTLIFIFLVYKEYLVMRIGQLYK